MLMMDQNVILNYELPRIVKAECITNGYESFHFKLNPEFTKSHSNIFIFTYVLNIKIQIDSYILINGINTLKKSKIITFKNKKCSTFINGTK